MEVKKTIRQQCELAMLDGMNTATEHAEAVRPGWSDVAYQVIRNITQGAEFTSESIRQKYHAAGFAAPPHMRAWGNPFRKARLDGLIEPVRMVKSELPKNHKGWIQLWRRTAKQ